MLSLREDQATEPKPTPGALALEHTDVVDGPTKATGTKRPQKPLTCSLCKGEGHTKRTCTLK